MPIAEEKALEILTELIKKPDTKAEDLPRIWGELLGTYNQHFAPVLEEPKKKRRKKRSGSENPNLGWPAGVSRAEYKAWKDAQEAAGKTENLNPQTYKREREAGLVVAEPVQNVVFIQRVEKTPKAVKAASAKKPVGRRPKTTK